MLVTKAIRLLLASTIALAIVPWLGVGRIESGQAPSQGPQGAILHVRARDGRVLPQTVRDQIRRVRNVGQLESFLDGKATDGVRVIGVEPAPVLHLRSGRELLAVNVVQGRSLEAGDSPEAMVVGATFAQHNKTALGLSIPAMLTRDHFPPIIVGGQGFAIVGIYFTGDPQLDDQVLVLLPTAQKLLNQPDRLSGVYVTPASPGAVDQVAGDLRRTLGDQVEVAPLALRQR